MVMPVPKDPYWTSEGAAEVFEALSNSELAEPAKPVRAAYEEYISILRQTEELEKTRLQVVEAGEEAIQAFKLARYKLFIQRVHASGKVYCDYGDHVVSEVSVRLLFNENCGAMYYVHHICWKCVQEIEAGKSGNICQFHEMKEEGGIKLRLKNGEWVPLPTRHVDHTDPEVDAYLPTKVAEQYGLPPGFGICGFD